MTGRRANHEGSIYRRSGGKGWIGSVRSGAARHYVSGRSRSEVVAKLGEVRQAAEDGLPVPSARLTFGAVAEAWLASRTAGGHLRPSTVLSYRGIVDKHLVPALGEQRMRTLPPEAIEGLLGDLASLSPRRRVYVREVARQICEFAVKRGFAARNPVLLVEAPAARRQPGAPAAVTPPAFSIDEVTAILQGTADDRLAALYVLAFATGARQGELFGLRWEDFEEAARRLTIRHALAIGPDGRPTLSEPKTRASVRTIPLPATACRALAEHRLRQEEERDAAGGLWHDDGLIFSTTIGTALNGPNVTKAFQRHLARLGLARRPFHAARHTAVTMLMAAGVSAPDAARFVGHARPTTTLNVYAHSTEGGLDRAADVMQKALGGGGADGPTRRA